MNPLLLPVEETKTIKYLNKHAYPQDQSSESVTQKPSHRDQFNARKMAPTGKRPSQIHNDPLAVHRLAMVESIESSGLQGESVQLGLGKGKHKKGKSMDLEEMKTNSKEIRVAGAQAFREKGKVTINMHFINDFRSRNSISQMKEYNHSKKLGTNKRASAQPPSTKRKKIRPDGQLRQIKKQIQHIIEATPLNTKRQRAGSKSSSKHSRPSVHSNKGLKATSRSSQLYTERKTRSTKNQKAFKSDFKHIGFSLPLTARMASLYSNNSSVFSSKTELDKLSKQQSYVIPTEQSMAELPEIRNFQTLALRKRSSDSLRNLRKVSLVQELEQQQPLCAETTQNIIGQYLRMLSDGQLFQQQILSQDFQEISQIPHQNSLKQKNEEVQSDLMLGSLNYENSCDVPELQMDNSDNQQSNQQINVHQDEIGKLNEIIEMIERKGYSSVQQKNQAILDKIKSLIAESAVIKTEENMESHLKVEDPENNKDEWKNDSMEWKQTSQQNVSIINLQMLDQALRERETYLIRKRDSEALRFDDNDPQLEKMMKWLNHQIKEVNHTRSQLWKGFNLAKNLLADEQGQPTPKRKQMMKCLSDKYLLHSKPKKHKKSKEIKEEELGKGRISQNHKKKAKAQHSESQSDSDSLVNIDIHNQFTEEQQLLDSNKKDYKFKQFQKPIEDGQDQHNSEDQQHENPLSSNSSVSVGVDLKKTLTQSLRLAEPANPPVTEAQSGGLNLQKLVCEIQYEDSFNEDELEQMARESEVAKNESMKLPFKLSLEDKEDIYEFIFLDLCIELTDEYSVQTPLMKKIFAFIKGLKQQSKKQKGFKTNTNAIKDYLYQLISFLKTQTAYLSEVHLNIDKPLGPTALDILKYMHPYDDEPPEEEGETVFILDIKLFEQFEQTYLQTLEFQKYYQDEDKEKKRRIFLKNAIHIHNKAIFDALNQTLDKQRPFGVWGQPFSWKHAPKFYHIRDTAAKNSLILKSAQKTIECGAYLCGFMVDKQDCNLKGNPNVTQSYIDNIRDDRLSRMLANQLEESEEKMLFIDDEETEILVEVAHTILQNLFTEICQELSLII